MLVVDDDPAQVVLLAHTLRKNGYRVLTANNPLQALELLNVEPKVHLVLTDLMMPYVDGIDFTQRLHELPAHADVPVIVLTAYGTDDVHDRGMRRGVALTLSKPVEISKLLDLVGFATH